MIAYIGANVDSFTKSFSKTGVIRYDR
jgi:hypothetical protein